MSTLERVSIVGASLAGLRAAEALRQAGYSGELTLIGAEDHLPYDRPPLSKDILRGNWEPEKAALTKEDGLRKLELNLRLGRRALRLDSAARRVELDDGSRIAFDGLLIATGATPRELPGTPDLPGIHTLRSLDDCLAIRAELERGPRVAVVGAGFIGAEVAATCRQRGLEVTLVESLAVPLEHALGADVGGALAARHREEGVDLRLGVGVDGFEGGDRVEGIRLADGSRVAADVVVVGIGVRPATDWLADSGLELDDGILCDATCATSLPGVVAAGDVARWHNPLFDETMRVEHWSNATEQAYAAASRLLAGDGDAQPYAPVPFFWSDQYDLKIQSAGRFSPSDESALVSGSLESGKFVKIYGRKGRFAGILAFNEPRKLMLLRRKLRDRPSWEEVLESETVARDESGPG